MLLILLCFTLELCDAALFNTCPHTHANNIHIVNDFGINSDQQTYVQQGLWHRLPCKVCRQDEILVRVIWYQGSGRRDPNKITLIQHVNDQNFPEEDRYGFSSDFSLVIKGVEASDEGAYFCQVAAIGSVDRFWKVDVTVIGSVLRVFPIVRNATSTLERNSRHKVSCSCAKVSVKVDITAVYWSTSKGITNDTDIIATRLPDGTVLQFQDGADYSIDSDSALIVNTLSSMIEAASSRFWCHVFFSDGTINNCYTDVQITETHPNDRALKVSATSYSLLKGKRQIIPCDIWVPKQPTCGVQWFKEGENSTRHLVLNYTSSSGHIDVAPGLDLASEFALVFVYVDDSHAGRYSCTTHAGNTTNDVHVIDQPAIPVINGPWLIIVCLFVIITAALCTITGLWIRRKRCRLHRSTGEDYESIPLPTTKSTFRNLIKEVEMFMRKRTSRIPITPWITCTDKSYRPMYDVYTQPELLVKNYAETCTVKYRLKSESEIFDDDIPQFSRRHVLLQGKQGSGKTTFLSKLACDWFKKKSEALLGNSELLFVLAADALVRSGSLGQAVLESMSFKSQQLSATSINECCAKYANEVVILIDGCDSAGDVNCIMNIIREKNLLECRIVITTKQTNNLEDDCKKHKLRHVVINGFTVNSAREYVTNMSRLNGENYSNLIDIIHKPSNLTEIFCLPANLAAFSQLSVWTKGKAFKPISTSNPDPTLKTVPTIGDLLLELVTGLFDRSPCKFEDSTSNVIDNPWSAMKQKLTKNQIKLLVDLGRITLPRLNEYTGQPFAFIRQDFMHLCYGEYSVLDLGIHVGLIRFDQYEGLLHSGSELVSKSEEEKLLPSPAENDKVYFVLDILQEFCAGVFLAHDDFKVKGSWIDQMQRLDINKNVHSLGRVVLLATWENSSVGYSMLKQLVEVERTKLKKMKAKGLLNKLQLPSQKVVELCLQLNFDCRWEGALNRTLDPLFENIKLVGISIHTLQLLSYVLKHASSNHGDRLKVRVIEVFQIGHQDWGELREYLQHFIPESLTDLDFDFTTTGDSADTLKLLCERVIAPKKWLYSPSQQTDSMKSELFLREVQRSGLQDILDYQSDDCHLSNEANMFVESLPCLKLLESLVLVGTILSSKNLCALANMLREFPSLKKLDLRLNGEFDDEAFLAVTKSLHECLKLSDLRLSLYKVTIGGLHAVKDVIVSIQVPWKRLKTLYVLHGPPQNTHPSYSYVKFLTDITKCLNNVKCYHISSLHEIGHIPDLELNELSHFIKNIDDRCIVNMGELDSLSVSSTTTKQKSILKKRSAEIKDQKRKETPGTTHSVDKIPATKSAPTGDTMFQASTETKHQLSLAV